jgi:myo-inositol-1(or 4)-monophosphatase
VALENALIATGFSYSAAQRVDQAAFVATMIPKVRDIRRFGAAAVDLCAVGSGWVDGYFEASLNEWDLAAGGLVATEAGALVTGRNGGPAGKEMTIAAAPALHAQLVAQIG